jgi:hypothetical protein
MSSGMIRAASVGSVLWGSPTLWKQVAGKEKLGSSIPTVFQRNILGILLDAVRKDGVLRTTKLDSKVNSNAYINQQRICHERTLYVHTCLYMYVQCMYLYLWIHSMKALFWNIKWITPGTHDAPAQI